MFLEWSQKFCYPARIETLLIPSSAVFITSSTRCRHRSVGSATVVSISNAGYVKFFYSTECKQRSNAGSKSPLQFADGDKHRLSQLLAQLRPWADQTLPVLLPALGLEITPMRNNDSGTNVAGSWADDWPDRWQLMFELDPFDSLGVKCDVPHGFLVGKIDALEKELIRRCPRVFSTDKRKGDALAASGALRLKILHWLTKNKEPPRCTRD